MGYARRGTVAARILASGAVCAVLLPAGVLADEAAAAAPKFDTGDTAWMLTSSALVLMMTIPGLALFYGGLVRSKNVLSTLMHSFFCAALISVTWVLFGYSLAFGPDVGGIDRQHRVLRLVRHPRHGERGRADDPADAVRHLPGDVRDHHSGAHLGDVRGAHALPGVRALHAALVDVPLQPARPLGVGRGLDRQRKIGALDFAGGTVVHISSGVSALVTALYLGKRVRAIQRPPCRRTTCRSR